MFNTYFRASALLFVILAISFLYYDIMLEYSLTFWWWDSYEHYLGGVVVGYFALWLGYLRFNRRISLAHTVLFLLAVGITWEIFEIVYPLGYSTYLTWGQDTVKDLILDALGAATAWYSTRWIKP